MINQTISEKIKQRRLQILIHSYIYYELNTNIVSDETWSRWAKELVELQTEHPDAANDVIYADVFRRFDGSTGFDLPYRSPEIVSKAKWLLSHF